MSDHIERAGWERETVLACIHRLERAGEITRAIACEAEAIYRSVVADPATRDLSVDDAEAYAALKTAQATAPSAEEARELTRRVSAMVEAIVERTALIAEGRKLH